MRYISSPPRIMEAVQAAVPSTGSGPPAVRTVACSVQSIRSLWPGRWWVAMAQFRAAERLERLQVVQVLGVPVLDCKKPRSIGVGCPRQDVSQLVLWSLTPKRGRGARRRGL